MINDELYEMPEIIYKYNDIALKSQNNDDYSSTSEFPTKIYYLENTKCILKITGGEE